jgi:hypothetical protein
MRTYFDTTTTQNSNKAGIYHRIGSCQYRGFTKTLGHIKMDFTPITVINNSEKWRERITSDEYEIIRIN